MIYRITWPLLLLAALLASLLSAASTAAVVPPATSAATTAATVTSTQRGRPARSVRGAVGGAARGRRRAGSRRGWSGGAASGCVLGRAASPGRTTRWWARSPGWTAGPGLRRHLAHPGSHLCVGLSCPGHLTQLGGRWAVPGSGL